MDFFDRWKKIGEESPEQIHIGILDLFPFPHTSQTLRKYLRKIVTNVTSAANLCNVSKVESFICVKVNLSYN